MHNIFLLLTQAEQFEFQKGAHFFTTFKLVNLPKKDLWKNRFLGHNLLK